MGERTSVSVPACRTAYVFYIKKILGTMHKSSSKQGLPLPAEDPSYMAA